MVIVTYCYNQQTRNQQVIQRRWVVPQHKTILSGVDAFTPFGGSGDTLERMKVLGGSLEIFSMSECFGSSEEYSFADTASAWSTPLSPESIYSPEAIRSAFPPVSPATSFAMRV